MPGFEMVSALIHVILPQAVKIATPRRSASWGDRQEHVAGVAIGFVEMVRAGQMITTRPSARSRLRPDRGALLRAVLPAVGLSRRSKGSSMSPSLRSRRSQALRRGRRAGRRVVPGSHRTVVAIMAAAARARATALRCINRIETIDAGRIGSAGTTSPQHAGCEWLHRDVGIVFQSYNLFPHLTPKRT